MTTVGYGDVTPYTINEKIFGMMVILLASCMFAYVMQNIGGIFLSLD